MKKKAIGTPILRERRYRTMDEHERVSRFWPNCKPIWWIFRKGFLVLSSVLFYNQFFQIWSVTGDFLINFSEVLHIFVYNK
jgi:hypothetical protein